MTDGRVLPEFTIDELEQLNHLRLARLTNEDAVELGLVAVGIVRQRELDLAVDIRIDGHLAFRAQLGATGAQNDEWLVGKAAVAMHFGEPSMLVRMRYRLLGRDVAADFPDRSDFRAHGGAIPLRVGDSVAGTITMSGEPDVIDHQTAADALRAFLALRR